MRAKHALYQLSYIPFISSFIKTKIPIFIVFLLLIRITCKFDKVLGKSNQKAK